MNSNHLPNSEAMSPLPAGRVSPCVQQQIHVPDSKDQAHGSLAVSIGTRNFMKTQVTDKDGATLLELGPFDVVFFRESDSPTDCSCKLDRSCRGYVWYQNMIETLKPGKYIESITGRQQRSLCIVTQPEFAASKKFDSCVNMAIKRLLTPNGLSTRFVPLVDVSYFITRKQVTIRSKTKVL